MAIKVISSKYRRLIVDRGMDTVTSKECSKKDIEVLYSEYSKKVSKPLFGINEMGSNNLAILIDIPDGNIENAEEYVGITCELDSLWYHYRDGISNLRNFMRQYYVGFMGGGSDDCCVECTFQSREAVSEIRVLLYEDDGRDLSFSLPEDSFYNKDILEGHVGMFYNKLDRKGIGEKYSLQDGILNLYDCITDIITQYNNSTIRELSILNCSNKKPGDYSNLYVGFKPAYREFGAKDGELDVIIVGA